MSRSARGRRRRLRPGARRWAVANRMAVDGVAVVIGHYCSGSSIPASPGLCRTASCRSRPPRPTRALTEEAAAKGWDNVFRTCGRDDKQGVVAGDYIAAHFQGKTIAVLDDKSAYGKGLADETGQAPGARGSPRPARILQCRVRRTTRPLVTRLKQSRADLVYVGGYHTEVGLLAAPGARPGLRRPVHVGRRQCHRRARPDRRPGRGRLPVHLRARSAQVRFRQAGRGDRAQGFDPEGYTL